VQEKGRARWENVPGETSSFSMEDWLAGMLFRWEELYGGAGRQRLLRDWLDRPVSESSQSGKGLDSLRHELSAKSHWRLNVRGKIDGAKGCFYLFTSPFAGRDCGDFLLA
jgi:hypothetical protein